MDIRGVYMFSSLMKQNKKAKICFVICFAGKKKLLFYIYAVIVKQKIYKRSSNYYSSTPQCIRQPRPRVYLKEGMYHTRLFRGQEAPVLRWQRLTWDSWILQRTTSLGTGEHPLGG
jgi:hypothetical protein